MNVLDLKLHQRAELLTNIINKVNQLIANPPKGRLRIYSSHGSPQYRICMLKTDKRGKYIKKKNINRVKSIAQRDYIQKIKKSAESELIAINKLIDKRTDTIETLYDRQITARKDLTSPIVMSDEEYARRWQKMDYQHKYFENTGRVYTSFKGEKMRSKSEVIIANILYLLGIPYHYEYPLELINGRIIYVDFLILDVKNRKEIWYEHFGMMGDMAYADPNTDRFNDIVAAGLLPGDNFIATFETYNKPLDTRTIFKILEPYRTNEGDIDLNQIEEEAAYFD